MAASENILIQQDDPNPGRGQRLWDFLTKPSDSITNRADRRQARTLAAFLFVFFLLTAVRVLIGLNSGSYLEEPEPFIAIVVLNILLLISYGLSRTKRYTIGSGLAVVATIITVISSIFLRGDYEPTRIFSSAMWLIPALILGSAFFSWKTTLGISVFTLASILMLPLIVPELEMDSVIPAFSRLFVVSVLVVLVDRFRDQLEADRQIELSLANQELERSSVLLEQRVTERTQALQLAAEISRVLSQITDMDSLLQESVETIRSRFNFYYVQIYLADVETNSLTLQAGTGNVGYELVRQGHRLIIGPGSINGATASEKRAVIVTNTAENPMFKPNAYLPQTRSEMAVPLLIGNQVVGVLDLQSDEPNVLSPENLPAFEALAGQLAVAIENARLLSEAAAARAEIESFTRRISREGWDSYLDAVEHPRFLGFSYDADALEPMNTPLTNALGEGNIAQVPIDVIGETVGAIQIEADEERTWTADDLDLIQQVALQVGQQVEMLRSLDEAAQYRQEAERALRQVTHEAWLTYEESPDLADGFAYDQVTITPVTAVSPTNDPEEEMLHRDLAIHGEAVGELAITKSENLDEALADELVTAVANQLVTHMESLRLSEQTEKALAETQLRGRDLSTINAVAEASAAQSNINEFLETVHHQLEQVIPMNSFTASTYDPADNKITFEYAYDENSGILTDSPPVTLEPYHLSYKIIHEAIPQIIHFTPEEVEEQRKNRPLNMMSEDASIMASLLFVPLVSGQEVVGVMSTQSYQFNVYNQEYINLLNGVAGYVTTAIQKARLFKEVETRAAELAVVNDIAHIVAQQIDQQELLKSVHEQIQRVLNVDAYFVAIYNPQTDLLEYPYIFDNNRVYVVAPAATTRTSKVYEVLQTSEPILINRTQAEIDEVIKKQESMIGDVQRPSASLLYVPLSIGYETLGVLSIQSYQINAYTQAHVQLLSGIANHVAVSLENTRLLESTQQAAEQEQMLREMSATINTSVDAESVLQTAAREIGRTLGLETYVYLVEGQAKNPEGNGSNKNPSPSSTNTQS